MSGSATKFCCHAPVQVGCKFSLSCGLLFYVMDFFGSSLHSSSSFRLVVSELVLVAAFLRRSVYLRPPELRAVGSLGASVVASLGLPWCCCSRFPRRVRVLCLVLVAKSFRGLSVCRESPLFLEERWSEAIFAIACWDSRYPAQSALRHPGSVGTATLSFRSMSEEPRPFRTVFLISQLRLFLRFVEKSHSGARRRHVITRWHRYGRVACVAAFRRRRSLRGGGEGKEGEGRRGLGRGGDGGYAVRLSPGAANRRPHTTRTRVCVMWRWPCATSVLGTCTFHDPVHKAINDGTVAVRTLPRHDPAVARGHPASSN